MLIPLPLYQINMYTNNLNIIGVFMGVYGCRSLSLQPKINKYTNNLGIIGAFRGVYVC